MAKPLERKIPVYPSIAQERGEEGWVILSYVIVEDGSVADVIVDDSNGIKAFEKAAARAVKKWQFEPATLDGEPTQQCHARVHVPFVLDMPQEDRGARRKFRKAYEKAARLLEEGDPDEATRIIAEQRKREPLNIYEEARMSILEASIARAAGDKDQELFHLERALSGKTDFIEPSVSAAVRQRIFILDVETRRFAEAIDTYGQMQSDPDNGPVPEAITESFNQITAFSHSDQEFSVGGRIGSAHPVGGDHGVWTHKLLRRTVGFSSDSLDQIAEYDLRCDFHRAKGQPRPDRALRIPQQWGACWLYVFGEPGTPFELIEYGTNL